MTVLSQHPSAHLPMSVAPTPSDISAADLQGGLLRSALVAPHRRAVPELEVLSGRVRSLDPRRTVRQRADSVVIMLSRHAAAVSAVVHPLLSGLPLGYEWIAEDRRSNHSLGLNLRRLRGALEGDAYAGGISPFATAQRIVHSLSEQEGRRLDWADQLEVGLSEAEQRELIARLAAAERRSPTRPHPYSSGSGFLGRASLRMWAPIDRMMDAVDNRSCQPLLAA